MKAETPIAVAVLLQAIDAAFDKKSWHGPNLRGSIRGLSLQEASFRPAEGRHNIWEHMVHAAYWKYTVWRRLGGHKRGSFPLKGSNWFPRPQERTEAAWKADVELLEAMHQQLRTAVEALTPQDLHVRPKGSKLSHQDVLLGIAAHDVYHAGQIQLLKRLARPDEAGRANNLNDAKS